MTKRKLKAGDEVTVDGVNGHIVTPFDKDRWVFEAAAPGIAGHRVVRLQDVEFGHKAPEPPEPADLPPGIPDGD